MSAVNGLNLALFAFLLSALVAIPLYYLRQSLRQTRGTFGRSYGNVVADMLQQSARRSQLLLRLAEAREARIARLERRAEGGR
jgi:hypothetical protein